MKLTCLTFFCLAFRLASLAQQIEVEYDKKRDLSQLKTFSFGESQIITPPDQKQVSDVTVDKWIKSSITRELEFKGLHPVDSLADIMITYVAGSLSKFDAGDVGPLGLTPGANPNRNYLNDYKEASLIIDFNDKGNNLIWRINASANLNVGFDRLVDSIVGKGLKKFSIQPRKKKRK